LLVPERIQRGSVPSLLEWMKTWLGARVRLEVVELPLKYLSFLGAVRMLHQHRAYEMQRSCEGATQFYQQLDLSAFVEMEVDGRCQRAYADWDYASPLRRLLRYGAVAAMIMKVKQSMME
jgi:hypothetical protein